MDTGEKDGAINYNSQPCALCAVPITEHDACVECFGKCKLSIHMGCLPGATVKEIQLLKKLPNAVFVCDACLALSDYDDNQNDKLLNDIHKKLDEFACVIDLAKNFEKNVRKILKDELVRINKRSIAAAEDKEEYQYSVVTRSAAKKRRVEHGDRETTNTSTTNQTPKLSFSKVVKNHTIGTAAELKKKLNNKPNPVVVIRPKQGVQVEDPRAELRNKIDGRNLNVRRVTSGRDGSVIVALNDEASVKLLEDNVDKQLDGRFEVKVRECMKPSIKIIGMSDEFEETELRDKLVSQNEVFSTLKHFKLRKTYCNTKWRYDNYSAIIELDAETFYNVLDAGKLNCGWNRCRVLDGLQVTRCYKCCGFNHKIAECKAEVVTCPICSGNHLVKECKSRTEKCANCEKLRIERKLNIDVNHSAWSSECPVYINQREKRNKMVDFST